MDLVVTFSILDPKGGTAKVLLKIAEKFNPLAIYTYKYFREKDSPFNEFNVIELGKSFRMMNPRAAYTFYNFKIKEDYDVINSHYSPSHWARNNNERMVWYPHTPNRAVYDLYNYRMSSYSIPKKISHYFYARFYRKYNQGIVDKIEKVFANSINVQKRLEFYLNKKSDVLYPCIDYKEFHNESYKKYFFYPSRIDPTKRMEEVIKVFNEFKKEHPEWELIIAGTLRKKDHDYYYSLRRIFKGKIYVNVSDEKMKELYANCYSVLFAGMNEDLGITPLEGMAFYKPVISVNEGGPKETIINEKTGFLVDSFEEMKEKMEYLANHKGIVEKMGKAGRKRIEENFNWNSFLRRFGIACKKVSKS